MDLRRPVAAGTKCFPFQGNRSRSNKSLNPHFLSSVFKISPSRSKPVHTLAPSRNQPYSSQKPGVGHSLVGTEHRVASDLVSLPAGAAGARGQVQLLGNSISFDSGHTRKAWTSRLSLCSNCFPPQISTIQSLLPNSHHPCLGPWPVKPLCRPRRKRWGAKALPCCPGSSYGL